MDYYTLVKQRIFIRAKKSLQLPGNDLVEAVQPHPAQPAATSQQTGHFYAVGATPCWVDHFLHPVRPKDLTSAVSFPELEGKKGVNLCLYCSPLVTVLARSLRSVFAPFVYHLSISFQMAGPLGIT